LFTLAFANFFFFLFLSFFLFSLLLCSFNACENLWIYIYSSHTYIHMHK
jgi:hypothetical protein